MTTPGEHCFDVFGRPMAVVRGADGWQVFWLGNEGKRRLADVHVPPSVQADELCMGLADLFDESAAPRHPDVIAGD